MHWNFVIYLALTLIYNGGKKSMVRATVDINLSEFRYLANHLKPFECRRLVAALHYDTYELPEDLDEAARKLSKDMKCLNLLLHWNSAESEGRGETHAVLEQRLRQLGHKKLADWLGKTTFKELSKDLLNSVNQPIADEVSTVPTVPVQPPESTTRPNDESYPDSANDSISHPISEQRRMKTVEHLNTISSKDKDWLSINMIVMLSIAGFLFLLIIACGICLIGRLARCESDEILCETEDEGEMLLRE
ncbi:hypothetical protein QAD02_018095 [Eretmocerus hayati]|uniref:Uncharacterized protein n=1 Tax=Eretmocerus hayati TaxID=131215 RepID=A0ACC2PGY4_9HYME|nr:hypothetical protein QAD02_018095 [Eretmocerus hayati]